ncbi:MAG: dihydrolipoamide acetyltransferase family protein [Solirubrobacteraceae bacterium]
MSELVMPRLSDTMEEGTILRWLKASGDTIARGEELVEIETDKATMTYESDLEGVLEIVAGEGTTLAVGELIATVGERGVADDGAPSSNGAPAAAADQAPAETSAAVESHPSGSGAPQAGGERVRASPLARRIATESGVDLHTLTGSGPGGRIVKADVLEGAPGPARPSAQDAIPGDGETADRAATGTPPADAPSPDATPQGVSTAKGETTDVELSRTQQTIARRMAESKATIPDFAIQIDVDMEECVALRTELKDLSAGSEDTAQLGTPTYNDMVVKASALALREHPRANSSYRDGRLQLHSRINVGVAVAAEGALVVPTVFDAEEKSLGEIARETRRLAERVREGSITPPELGGGTFTVSNLGMYGVRSFTPIINPPQAAILSVGSLEPRAVVRDGAVVARNTMTLTLVCDHRILYGADAAQLLARIRELLQTPSALTL